MHFREDYQAADEAIRQVRQCLVDRRQARADLGKAVMRDPDLGKGNITLWSEYETVVAREDDLSAALGALENLL